RKRIRKPHERADESRQRDELKQLVRRVMKAGLRQLGCDDAPEQPDRKPEMLGKNRPDEITLSDGFARGVPERLILRIPIRNPGRSPLPHQYVPFWVAMAAVARAIPLRADGKTKKTPPPGARKRLSRAAALPVASCAKTATPPALAAPRVALYKLRANPPAAKKNLIKSIG